MGWCVQGLSGAGFGAISYVYYQQFPDLHDIALMALLLKMSCVLAGIAVATAYLRYLGVWSLVRQDMAWNGLIVLGVRALTAAAFLRWFA